MAAQGKIAGSSVLVLEFQAVFMWTSLIVAASWFSEQVNWDFFYLWISNTVLQMASSVSRLLNSDFLKQAVINVCL